MKLKLGNWYWNSYSKEYYVIVSQVRNYFVAYSLNDCNATTIPKDKKNRGGWSRSFSKPDVSKLDRAIKKAISAKLKKALIQNYSEII